MVSRNKVQKAITKPNLYRFMCLRAKNTNYHIDFPTKEEAMEYVNELNDPKIEWFGVYEIDEKRDTLKSVYQKRLIPFCV